MSGGIALVGDMHEQCPICKHAIKPIKASVHHWESSVNGSEQKFLDVAFVCPRESCSRMFIGAFVCLDPIARSGQVKRYECLHVAPKKPSKPTHAPEIAEVSPNFVELYRQASAAETYKLGDIVGGAYRKALEFLIKDSCIRKNPDKETKIRKLLLAAVINNYVEDANVKVCASRAAWLGNDETHYERRWVDKDIEDMKVLIQLTCNWIVNEALTEKYLAEMPAKDNGRLT